MASVLSARITKLIGSLRKIQDGNLSVRATVDSRDEMGELANSVNNMTESLQELLEENKLALERAEMSNKAKSDFLANMSHELRTPLNAIIGFSDVMKNEMYGPIQPVTYAHYADDIHNSGQHLLTLINDVLDVARIGSGEFDINEAEFDLPQTLEDSLRMLHPIIEQKSLKINFDNTRLPLIYGDERRIKQVLLNVLSNAAKFTHESGQISISSAINNLGDIEIRIKDSGIGMNQEEIKIALTPFAQVQSSLARQYEGTGLGLPLAHNLLEMHNGTLNIESEPGIGTEVIITLPKDRIRT
ncbi:MAG: sensor histidine kinase [Terasakiella sp.]